MENEKEGVDLDYYLWKNKIRHKDFAKAVGISLNTLSMIVNKKRTVNLATAIKIHLETKGAVSLYNLLLPEEKEVVNKKYGVVKDNSIYKDDKDDTHPGPKLRLIESEGEIENG